MKKSDFHKLNHFEKSRMPIGELSKYYADLRAYEYNNGKELKGIGARQINHGLVKLILKADQRIANEKIIVLNNQSSNGKASKIYACTHIGGNDIQRTLQVIGVPAYLMLGDPGILYRDIAYQGLRINGLISLDNDNRIDRNIAYSRSVELLRKGGNLLIFPEGAWSISPNLLLMKIFTGTVRMAKETGAEIIPIAVEQYEKDFYFNIGQNYKISKNSLKSAEELTDELREKMATLKWEILENQKISSRKNIPEGYLQEFEDEILGRCNYESGMAREDLERERFHDKRITNPQDAFVFMDKLKPCINNAFLFRRDV
ncbi:MAG: 1-acyl-sn-glycerol-3-phosphate acyltransferase [Lachnospiraceae bacterium]|nr:1-acyl-sn-glycerol-3-phosphate acyltransferase [Lachnospiraceae bacterium]